MKAILSDVHGNLEALQAVLTDAAHQGAHAIYCLGDLVGYGPNPRECVELAMRWPIVLRGNIDEVALADPPDLGPTAVALTRSVRRAREQLTAPEPDSEAAGRRWRFLRGLPPVHREGDTLFVHGSSRNPLYEYVFPEDVYNQPKMDGVFALVERYCFQGHTHVPGVFLEQAPDDLYVFHSPEEIDYVHKLDHRKTLVNVGSVGQPRDGDPRACYVLLDTTSVRFRRVEYDLETTVRKIRDLDDRDAFFGSRLRSGQ